LKKKGFYGLRGQTQEKVVSDHREKSRMESRRRELKV